MRPRDVTLTGPEAAQVRRAAATLRHLAKDARVGADPDTIARRIDEVAESLAYLLDRAEGRGTLH